MATVRAFNVKFNAIIGARRRSADVPIPTSVRQSAVAYRRAQYNKYTRTQAAWVHAWNVRLGAVTGVRPRHSAAPSPASVR